MTNFNVLYREHSDWVLQLLARVMFSNARCPSQTCTGCTFKDGDQHVCFLDPHHIYGWLKQENAEKQPE